MEETIIEFLTKNLVDKFNGHDICVSYSILENNDIFVNFCIDGISISCGYSRISNEGSFQKAKEKALLLCAMSALNRIIEKHMDVKKLKNLYKS